MGFQTLPQLIVWEVHLQTMVAYTNLHFVYPTRLVALKRFCKQFEKFVYVLKISIPLLHVLSSSCSVLLLGVFMLVHQNGLLSRVVFYSLHSPHPSPPPPLTTPIPSTHHTHPLHSPHPSPPLTTPIPSTHHTHPLHSPHPSAPLTTPIPSTHHTHPLPFH